MQALIVYMFRYDGEAVWVLILGESQIYVSSTMSTQIICKQALGPKTT